MQNAPAKPAYTTQGTPNKPVDHDDDQFAQDTGSALGYGEEAGNSTEEAQLEYDISERDEAEDPTLED